MGTIRLACLMCDEDGFDGIDEIPADWLDVDEVQSYEQSMNEARDSTGWWTHLGVCPACQEHRFEPAERDAVAR